MQKSEILRDFVGLAGMKPGCVRLLILEHEDSLKDPQLVTLFPWSGADLERMAKFRHQGSKTSWCFSRFLFRHALASASGLELQDLNLDYGPYGKPFLPGSTLRFNWSHTPGCVVLALSLSEELGCDVEDVRRPVTDFGDIAKQFFSEAEQAWIQEADTTSGAWERFLQLFVEKEARIKASGLGLHAELSDVGGTLQDAPFREGPLCCFWQGPDARYLVALCAPSLTAMELDIRSYSFEL